MTLADRIQARRAAQASQTAEESRYGGQGTGTEQSLRERLAPYRRTLAATVAAMQDNPDFQRVFGRSRLDEGARFTGEDGTSTGRFQMRFDNASTAERSHHMMDLRLTASDDGVPVHFVARLHAFGEPADLSNPPVVNEHLDSPTGLAVKLEDAVADYLVSLDPVAAPRM